jgi:uncharacterized phage protein (TIGR02218 family)
MKTISSNLLEKWQAESTTIATCWRLNLTNGTVMGFTDHDKDIIYDGVTYEAATGFTPTSFEQSGDMSVDGMDIKAFLDSQTITAGDIAAGIYDYAEFRVFKIDWANQDLGIMKIQRGWIGEISRKDDVFVAEIRSLTQAFQQQIGRSYTGQCDAALGDSRCGVTLASYTETGTVTSVTSNSEFTDSSRAEAADYFNYGLLTWTGGANNGRSMEVKDFGSGAFVLFQPMPSNIAVGDTYSVYAGCNKLLSTCKDKFNNVDNFRGFPHIPGKDAMAQR